MRGSLAACAVYRVRLASSGCALSFSLTIPYHTFAGMSTTFFRKGGNFLRVKRALHFCRSRRWPDLSRLDRAALSRLLRAALPALTVPRRDPPSRTCRLLTYHDTGGRVYTVGGGRSTNPGHVITSQPQPQFSVAISHPFFSPRTPPNHSISPPCCPS